MRDDGRAVLLVDHNVKSVARLVDRVLAMYVGERIAEGSADEVMRNETVRRVYLGGSIETAARPESSFRDTTTPFLEVENVSVHYGKAQALDDVSIHVHAGEFVSVVGLNGAGKTTLFNTISGFLPYAGDIRREGASLRGLTAATIARKGIVQCPEGRELFVDMSVRENLDLGGQHLPPAECAEQIAWLFDLFPILRDRQKQAAGTLSGGEQQMLTIARALMMKPKLAHPRRADARLGAGHPRAIVQGPGAPATDHADHGAARRAERHLRAAARRPRLCARTRPHRLGRRAGAFRRRRRHRLSVGRRRLAAFGCGRFWQLAAVFGEIPVAPVVATDLAIAVVVSRSRLSFRAVAHAKSPAVDLRECGDRPKCKTENDDYQD